jgi:alkylation response protein AidB-like acyl-CoA dehydrogenase
MTESPKFQEAFIIVKNISQNILAKYADECDRENRFPKESLEAIKEHRLQALLIPKDYGGWGLTFYEYQKCLSFMAQYCASTASAFNMHNIVVGSVSNYNLSSLPVKTKERVTHTLLQLYKQVVEEKMIFAAATTEPNIGARFSKVKTTFARTDDGYIINGTKSFVTMAEYADYYLVLADKKLAEDEIKNDQCLSYFLVPRVTEGITINKTWDVLGMRGTASQEVTFNNVKVARKALFMNYEGFALSKVLREPHWVTGGYLGVYLGIMEAIFNFTCHYIRSRSNSDQQDSLASQPLIQARIGKMFTLLNNARLNVYEAAKKVDAEPTTAESHQAIFSAKYVLGESMPKIASMALRTCGGSSIHKKFQLERYLRDSHCGGLMPTVTDMCQIFLGQSALGITKINIW